MIPSGASTGPGPSGEGAAHRAYLIPTAAGAWFAVSLDRDPSRRDLLLALLRGASGFPISLDWFTQWTGLSERRAIASLLFALQREGLLTGDATPLAPPHGPLSTVLAPLLERMANGAEVVLADPTGLCVAYAGLAPEAAELLAARIASLDPRLRRLATDGEVWSLGGDGSGPRLAVQPLHLSPYRFLLVTGQSANLGGLDFVQLMSVLARYCLGTIRPTTTEPTSSP